MRAWPWIAGLGTPSIATVARARHELHTDGGLSRGTAAVLDVLYLATSARSSTSARATGGSRPPQRR